MVLGTSKKMAMLNLQANTMIVSSQLLEVFAMSEGWYSAIASHFGGR